MKRTAGVIETQAAVETSENSDSEEELYPESHEKYLEKLKYTDPDFYTFLEENDEDLLNFDVDSGDVESDKNEEYDDDVHKPGTLQGDSDESDFEDDYAKPVQGINTLKMVAQCSDHVRREAGLRIKHLEANKRIELQILNTKLEIEEIKKRVEEIKKRAAAMAAERNRNLLEISKLELIELKKRLDL